MLLEVRNIVKDYARHRALDHVSLSIEKGSIFGLLGPNGAGKTSLIRIINQITAPDEGEIIFDGELLTQKHTAQIGYLPEERGLYKKMLIGDQMLYLAQLKGLSKGEATKRIRHWFEKMEMQTWWSKKVEDLSKGMQQKVQFVATVIHEPALLILDEPFTGFDPVNAAIIKEEILNLNKNGATVIFSTHRMESVEELCDHIVLINQSKKILDGKLAEIKDQYRNEVYKISYHVHAEQPFIHASELYDVIDTETHHRGVSTTIKIKKPYAINDVLTHLIAAKASIQELREVVPTINDIFIREVKKVDEP